MVALPKPDFERPCKHCKAKKVKANLDCNIAEEVGYSHKTVEPIIRQLEQSKKDSLIENVAHEVGSLVVTNNINSGKYIGAATGLNFARLFLKQLDLKNNLDKPNTSDFENFDLEVTQSCAALPSQQMSKFLLQKYIDTLQIYYPIHNIPQLLLLQTNIYERPQEISRYEKYTFFMIMAIASQKLTHADAIRNPFTPNEYYNTASRYLENILGNRSEKSLQALLLLVIWKLESDALEDDNGDLWYLSRFCMSLAMELGVHRYNPTWSFGEERDEQRNRLFWCSYIADRSVAMKFGRGLSLRTKAIDTPLPKLLKDDYIINLKTSYNEVQLLPSIMLIKISEIAGDMLESVYTSRTTGSEPPLDDEQIQSIRSELQDRLDIWMKQVEIEVPNNLICYHELKVRYCVFSIVLNRPSPSFPLPDGVAVQLCKEKCILGVECYNSLIASAWKVTPTCLHDILAIGLTMIYCCWRLESNATDINNFSRRLLKIMQEACTYYPKYTRFKSLYETVSGAIAEQLDREVKTKRKMDPGTRVSMDPHNQLEWNEWFSQEVFHDGFRQFYDLANNHLIEGLADFVQNVSARIEN
ncbi:hypothetical protein KL935_002177 [Ogataea polymorpha]|nr:hypothetical protein KL937_001596 [Ogataea polymorpha]KAG7902217.1 hypothetical protein KL935_002177 [Ogataea polymorpha]KAG7911253.1 hypothetical protein KL906_001633 [Ogataea polymorpha]KAG7918201.1 hypothetical protein KL927_001658 [Ogataea polymorpha]KAG7939063.1 hypothetical protein KL904_001592 [Ogataea polymorpha]